MASGDALPSLAAVASVLLGGAVLWLRADLKIAKAARRAAEARAEELDTALGRIGDVVEGNSDLWRRTPVKPPEDYAERLGRSIPIIVFANLKGGVGKTTLAANTAAYFDARGERVLLIDLDYQGSLSAMSVAGPEARDLAAPGAVRLMTTGELAPLPLGGAGSGSELIDCYYPFFNEENRALVRWLMAGPEAADPRYALAETLLGEAVQAHYDRVIIDTAPRVTMGFVAALTSATHLMIPTQLNRLSAEAVESFLATLDALGPPLLRGLAGFRIVGVQKRSSRAPTRAEADALQFLRSVVDARGYPQGRILEDVVVPQREVFARAAGTQIAYFAEPEARKLVDPVGEAIARFAERRTPRA